MKSLSASVYLSANVNKVKSLSAICKSLSAIVNICKSLSDSINKFQFLSVILSQSASSSLSPQVREAGNLPLRLRESMLSALRPTLNVSQLDRNLLWFGMEGWSLCFNLLF